MSDDAVRRQREAWQRSAAIDRREWSSQEWVNDANRLFNERDGAITGLVNGHVRCMLEELDRLGFPWETDGDDRDRIGIDDE